ncbi:hypothetical protein PHYC_01388 [Phycisphaerales bacterium]|nr:hypothetical protein PHYC_01388 [Phycisphaerales bacterium]
MKPSTFASLTAGSIIVLVAANWAAFGAGSRDPRATHSDCCAVGADHAESFRVAHTLTLEGAERALAAATALAGARNAGAAIAVVDDGGYLIAFHRLEGTFAAGAEVSIGKARTAAIFRKPTKAFEDAINGGRVALASVSQMTPLQGGVPIMHDGHVIGAIGVSGAHSQIEDEEIALAGAAAVSSPLAK